MNIIKLLNEHGITCTIMYYGLNDMATGFEVKNVLENSQIIDSYLKKIKCTISNLDEYIDYLYLKCMAKYDEVIPIVKEDSRDAFSKQIANIKKIYSKYTQKDLALFVKENYQKILNNKFGGLNIKHDVIDYTIEFIIKYCSKEKEIIKYVISNFSYKVYDNFDSFKKLFNNSDNLEYYDLLLTKELMKENFDYRLYEIANVLAALKLKDLNKYDDKVNILVDFVKSENFNTSIDKVMTTYTRIENMKKVLANLEHKSFYEFEKELNIQQKILDEYLKKYGQCTEYTINIKPIVELYEDKSKKWYQKSLIFTHTRDKEAKNGLISNLDYIIKYGEKSQLADLVSSNIPTDDKFTFSVTSNISLLMLKEKYLINYMIEDDNRLNDLISYIFLGVNNYFKKDSLYYNSKYFELDLNMLFNALKEFKQASKDKAELKMKWHVYSIGSQLNGIIEKILRNIYYDKTKENKYINSKNATLHNLISSKEVMEVLGQNNCDCLDYYLLNRNGVGENLRNIFAHYNEKMYDKLIYDTILELLYLLLLVSNALLASTIKD